MIDGPFRKHLPRVAAPLIALYGRLGLTPNQVTVLGFGFACAAAGSAAIGWTWLAVLLWWIGRLLDGTDGIYAREGGLVTDFGGYLDIVVDMASYSVMVLGLRVWRPDMDAAWVAMLVLYVLCITSALSLGNLQRERGHEDRDNRSLKLAAGLAEGGETGIAYTLFLLFPQQLGLWTSLWLLILITTVVARTLFARRVLTAG